jgi:two-component system chemotaxis sensor kinase CheA
VDLSRYKGLFLSEAAEHLHTIDQGIVALERDPGAQAVLESVFRSAHSLKGMAGAMGYQGLQSVAHALEDLLEPMRHRGQVRPGSTDLLLFAVDAMREIVASIEADRPAEVDAGAVLDRIAEFRQAEGGMASVAGPAPNAEPVALRPEARPPGPGPGPELLAGGPGKEPSRGLSRRDWLVQTEVAPSCTTPAIRGFIVYRKVAGLGDVISAEPPVDAIKAGEFKGLLRIRLRSVLEAGEIESVLATIPDLARFTVAPAPVEKEPETEPPPQPALRVPVQPRAPVPLERPRASASVRVRTELLDHFMDSVADLLMAKARLQESLRRYRDREVEEGLGLLERAVREVHDRVMEVRLLPVSTVTERLPRLVRDLAVRRGKRVRLEVSGAEVEMDRAVVEALDSPLVHLTRNAVDHGIESPDERVMAGKAADGRLWVSARRERDEVVVEVADDGRGIDPARLRAEAVARGLVAAKRVEAMEDREVLQLVFLPGLSTATEVSDVSGRGVGMDAVKAAVEALGGRLEVSSAVGVGTRVVMRLPLTVAVMNVLSVVVAGQQYAFPVTKVERTVLAGASSLAEVSGRLCYAVTGAAPLPILNLAELLGIEGHPLSRPPLPLLVVATESGLVALWVDKLLGQREVVLRPLGKLLERIEGLSGIALFSDGRPAFLLDPVKLCRAAGAGARFRAPAEKAPPGMATGDGNAPRQQAG